MAFRALGPYFSPKQHSAIGALHTASLRGTCHGDSMERANENCESKESEAPGGHSARQNRIVMT